jgi:hypothetical protein
VVLVVLAAGWCGVVLLVPGLRVGAAASTAAESDFSLASSPPLHFLSSSSVCLCCRASYSRANRLPAGSSLFFCSVLLGKLFSHSFCHPSCLSQTSSHIFNRRRSFSAPHTVPSLLARLAPRPEFLRPPRPTRPVFSLARIIHFASSWVMTSRAFVGSR